MNYLIRIDDYYEIVAEDSERLLEVLFNEVFLPQDLPDLFISTESRDGCMILWIKRLKTSDDTKNAEEYLKNIEDAHENLYKIMCS